MTRIILLDLDDTLLNNNMDAFQAAYLRALGKHLSPYIKPDIMIKELLTGTRHMVENCRPSQTLRSVFNQHFYPAIGAALNELQPVIDQFYQDVFPSLQPHTSPKPEANTFVERCKTRNYRLVVATNPLFPKSAILQRIQWAGFDPRQFDLITCYETFHFAKPNPAFYCEILGQLGRPQDPAFMIGNDLEADIAPANLAGLNTFWLTDTENKTSIIPDYAGSFSEAWEWIESFPEGRAKTLPATAPGLITCLSATPASLAGMVANASEVGWQVRHSAGEWNLVEILCHLRDIEKEVHQKHFQLGSTAASMFLPAIPHDTWATQRNYAEQDGSTALQEFTSRREETLAMLKSLPDQTWDWPVRHGVFGPTSFMEVVQYACVHDWDHLRQVWNALKVRALSHSPAGDVNFL
jgi:FMN phosphatase YigB (HAD superfamily)